MVTQVMELNEPVEDQLGYVYEKAAILEMLRKRGGTMKCPNAGEAQSWAEVPKCCALGTSMYRRSARSR